MRVSDGRTDGYTEISSVGPRLHSMQRGKNWLPFSSQDADSKLTMETNLCVHSSDVF